MAIRKITESEIAEKQIASKPDRMTGTAAENKAAFDALVKLVIAVYNDTMTQLAGSGGAGEIGATPFTGVTGATIQAQLEALQKNITNLSVGSVPDNSIGTEKLINAAVMAEKIAAGAVTAAKLASAAVLTEKIADGAVTAEKLASAAVPTAKLTDGAVTAEKLADGSVGTAKLADAAVTLAKISGGVIPDNWLSTNPLKISTGSYTGTGYYGSSQRVLTFGFAAKFFLVHGEQNQAGFLFGIRPSEKGATRSTDGTRLWLTWTDTGVKYTLAGATSAYGECNESGVTYHWVAIG